MTKSEEYQTRAENHLRKYYEFTEKSLISLLAERGLSRNVFEVEKQRNGYYLTVSYDKNGSTISRIFVPAGVVKVYTTLQLVEYINARIPDVCRLSGKDLVKE